MKQRLLLLAAAIGSIIATIRCNKSAEVVRHEAHWEYENPDWQQIGYSECGSKAQSPINIETSNTITSEDLPDISVSYSPFAMNIVDNGHTIQVNATDDKNTTLFNGSTYRFAQFHLHRHSEHTINGDASAMELHIVHIDDEGNIMVYARMIKEGAKNEFLQAVFDNIPDVKKKEVVTGVMLDLNNIIPEQKGFYTYAGTLTTPPCSHAVQFVIFGAPMEASHEQIMLFSSYYPNNARPVQPLNNRFILEKKN